MLIQIVFVLYFVLFQLTVFFIGLNSAFIMQRYQMAPRILSFIVPLLVNFPIGNFVFRQIHPVISVLGVCLVSLAISLKMQKVRVIGLTGSIATGKSTLTRLIGSNLPIIDIIDCDDISRRLRKKGQAGYSLLVKMLGDRAQEYLNPLTQEFEEQGRQKLNKYVFSNHEFRRRLTKGMGKLILLRVFKKILTNILTGKNIMLVDAPLLYETKILEYICYPVVVVGCSQEVQVKRLRGRDRYTQEEAKERIRSQMSLDEKRKKTKFYINNEGNQKDLIQEFSAKIKRYLDEKMLKVIEFQPKINQPSRDMPKKHKQAPSQPVIVSDQQD